MQVTTNPEEMRDLAGLRSVAEVYRTLDKMAIRKEYHEALLRHNIDLDNIVCGIKNICEESEDDGVRLRGYQSLLKSLGLDEYKEKDSEAKNSWEETVKEAVMRTDRQKKLSSSYQQDYEVNEPEIPEEAKKRQEEERETGKELYEE